MFLLLLGSISKYSGDKRDTQLISYPAWLELDSSQHSGRLRRRQELEVICNFSHAVQEQWDCDAVYSGQDADFLMLSRKRILIFNHRVYAPLQE